MLGYPRSRQSDVLLWVAWEVFLMATIIERPEIVTVAHLEFLDEFANFWRYKHVRSGALLAA